MLTINNICGSIFIVLPYFIEIDNISEDTDNYWINNYENFIVKQEDEIPYIKKDSVF